MATPFLSEIKIFSFDYAPKGWALCNGQTLPINQNQALFSLLGTTYGGNGVQTFQLPDLRGRTSIHPDNSSFILGQKAGEENHTLIQGEIPPHTHQLNASSNNANQAAPAGNLLAKSGSLAMYANTQDGTTSAALIGNSGGSQPHTNLQPYLVLNFCIALTGIFPSRN